MKIADLKACGELFRSAIFTICICGIESNKYSGVPTSNMIILGGHGPKTFRNPCFNKQKILSQVGGKVSANQDRVLID